MKRLIKRALNLLGIGTGSASDPSKVDHSGILGRFVIHNSDGEPYLTRVYLWSGFGYAAMLHRIHRSDDDRALHDHPWPFVSLLVGGPGYTEHLERGPRFVPAWSLNVKLDPTELHRLEVHGPQTTLVLRGRRTRAWGFKVPGHGWVHWRDFESFIQARERGNAWVS